MARLRKKTSKNFWLPAKKMKPTCKKKFRI
jgi:hypothetical protein